MREVVIAILAAFLIGIMVAALVDISCYDRSPFPAALTSGSIDLGQCRH